jgi:hypothetical protein
MTEALTGRAASFKRLYLDCPNDGREIVLLTGSQDRVLSFTGIYRQFGAHLGPHECLGLKSQRLGLNCVYVITVWRSDLTRCRSFLGGNPKIVEFTTDKETVRRSRKLRHGSGLQP